MSKPAFGPVSRDWSPGSDETDHNQQMENEMAYAKCTIGGKAYEFETGEMTFEPGQKIWVNTARGKAKARFGEYVDEPEYDGKLQTIIGPREEDEESQ